MKRAWIVTMVLVVVVLSGCGGSYSFSAGSNWKTTDFTGAWSPDPNGGVGIRMVTDSLIPEGTTDNVAVGPYIDFYLSRATGQILDAILPGNWDPLKGAPLDIYGTLAFLWETDGGKFVFAPGTEFRLFPGRPVQPCFRLEYVKPEAGAGIREELLPIFGARIEIH